MTFAKVQASAQRFVVWRSAAIAATAAAAFVLGTGCASTSKTTVLTTKDFSDVEAELASQIQNDIGNGELGKRTHESPAMRIAVQRVLNYTSDIIPAGTKQQLMVRVCQTLPKSLLNDKNIVFVISNEKANAARASGAIESNAYDQREAPTHFLRAIFRTATRSTDKGRVEAYLCDYELIGANSGELIWNGQVELKKWAEGRPFD